MSVLENETFCRILHEANDCSSSTVRDNIITHINIVKIIVMMIHF